MQAGERVGKGCDGGGCAQTGSTRILLASGSLCARMRAGRVAEQNPNPQVGVPLTSGSTPSSGMPPSWKRRRSCIAVIAWSRAGTLFITAPTNGTCGGVKV